MFLKPFRHFGCGILGTGYPPGFKLPGGGGLSLNNARVASTRKLKLLSSFTKPLFADCDQARRRHDLQLLCVRIFGEFCWISQKWEATTAKRMKIDPHCQRHGCNPLNVLFNVMLLALICRRFLCWGPSYTVHILLSRAYLSVNYAFLFSMTEICQTGRETRQKSMIVVECRPVALPMS